MRSILAIAAGALAACASSGPPAPGTPLPPGWTEADLRARYQQYRSGPPPHLDFETWKRTFANPPDYSGSGS